MRGNGIGGVKEGERRRRNETKKRVGLVGPVEPTGSARVTGGERVLRPVVVLCGLGYVLGWVLREMVREAGGGGVNHCPREKG